MNNFSPFHPLIIIIITTATIIRRPARLLPLRAPVVMYNLQPTSSNLLIVPRPCFCCTLLPDCLPGCCYHDITLRVGFLTARDEQCLNHPIQCGTIITFGGGWMWQCSIPHLTKRRVGGKTVRRTAYITMKQDNRCKWNCFQLRVR